MYRALPITENTNLQDPDFAVDFRIHFLSCFLAGPPTPSLGSSSLSTSAECAVTYQFAGAAGWVILISSGLGNHWINARERPQKEGGGRRNMLTSVDEHQMGCDLLSTIRDGDIEEPDNADRLSGMVRLKSRVCKENTIALYKVFW